MQRVALSVVLLLSVMTPIAGASSESLSEPWHPAREYLLAVVSDGSLGSYDVWHPDVNEIQAMIIDLMMKATSAELRADVSASEAQRRTTVFEAESAKHSFYSIEHHPDKPWAIVRTSELNGKPVGFNSGVALYGDEWRIVVPLIAESWDVFGEFLAEAPQESSSSPERAEPKSDEPEWIRLDGNWRYRNATIRRDPFLPTFLVEFQRTGPAVQMAMFTVTLYDSTDRIVTTGNGTILATNSGSIRTVEFLLRGDAEKATKFRLQLDAEL